MKRYATSRQKACFRCSAAKLKCDRAPGRCSRCAAKDVACTYPHANSSKTSNDTTSENVEGSFVGDDNIETRTPYAQHPVFDPEAFLPAEDRHADSTVEYPLPDTSNISRASPALTRSQLLADAHLSDNDTSLPTIEPSVPANNIPSSDEFCCPIDADNIKNRWLNAYFSVPGQKTKKYSTSISAYIFRILKSYAAVVTHGRGVPAFVHHSQVTSDSMSQPLASCLTLARMCERPISGSAGVAMEVLQREMNNVYEQHGTYDDAGSLAALQACLIYSMIIFFHLGQSQSPILQEAMVNLQHLACMSSRRGLMCTAEKQHARPRWEAWILMEAKRRTLYTMYLFDSALSAQDGLPTALGTELTGLPAPSNKQLWRAQSSHEWEGAYNTHLADFGQGLRIDELWPVPPEIDQARRLERSRRVDRWLQDVDEYGTMLYAVTSCTHGA